ncbi:glutathione amide reductase [Variibacter gotjawalensis]|uniref:Glutathione reductase n=1 Tax=Variibacter gotjawalensis TaxID=1333996 RepID=A0A0S3PZ19_9BRAD|nr:glutathione-disulfide reductase [Variibacter gotjawalensis]NIK46987.1 glutathione reductase (NADPH) [Variibacter gotjawalensis]RZS48891.1 NADPH-glutathione reductase [Variibacter gotjawalensis]BAT61150.1 glutathione amide reductase [Variibacter gotjawalensis]
MADSELDLFVIGGGSGGVRAARISSGHGAKVMLAEEFRMGGTCVIRGCVPKKLLVYASRFSHEFEDAHAYGWSFGTPSFDWPTLIANKDKEIDRLEAAYTSTLKNAKVETVKDRAVIEDANTVRLVKSGQRIRTKNILIATGGWPHMGDAIPGREHAISSNEALHLETLPRRIVIQGGGYIALEFACIFAGMGSEVTVVYRGENILRGFDNELRQHLRDEMERRGIKVLTGAKITGITPHGAAFQVTMSAGGDIEADKVMFATGRVPHSKDLGLEAVGVKTDGKGAIVVDGFSQTSVPNIYAVGDVTNRINLTPVAIREGHAFADTVFGKKQTRVDHNDVPTAVFTEPELGVVGLTEEEAREKFGRVIIYRTSFRPMKVTLSGRQTKAFFKLVVDGITDRVVGCHIAGPDAGEMIQVVGIAVKMGATKADFDATMAVHPTAAEELVTMRTPTAIYDRAAAE